MLTGIRIINKDFSDSYNLESNSYICALESDSYIQLQAIDGTLRLQLSEDVLIRYPDRAQLDGSIYTINQIQPAAWNGNFNILGSLCTSVTDTTDKEDPEQLAGSNSLLIFDGCFSCNTCNVLAQLQEDIQNCQIWINGLKDCNLYYEPAASHMWDNMIAHKTEMPVQCHVNKTGLQSRQEAFGQATKLFYQYKAAVAMWNYLVKNRSYRKIQIVGAPQDYSGFVVQAKNKLDTCNSDAQELPKTLKLEIRLISGQIPELLQQANRGMGIFAAYVEQNSYIQYTLDTGIGQAIQSDAVDIEITSDSNDKPLVRALFTFDPEQPASTIFSASVKILPIVYLKGQTYQKSDQTPIQAPSQQIAAITLQQWIAFRPYATTITQAQQTEKNLWKVDAYWFDSAQADTYYYTTSYSKYPIESDSTQAEEAQ